MPSESGSETDDGISASVLDEPTISGATADVSLLHHEKDALLEKTKAQENEIMSLRLKVEAYENKKQELQEIDPGGLTHEEKASLEQEIGVLRGKVALLERNNRVFSNEERTELKQELERTKRRFQRLNDQLASVRNSMEYDHINHVERALENFVKKVKILERDNNELRKMNISEGRNAGDLSSKLIEEKEEIIKDQTVQIEELEHQINALKSRVTGDQTKKDDSSLPAADDKAFESPTTQRRSPVRTSRSRLSSRSKRARSVDKSSQSDSDCSTSDSDARAVREMCNKMREDIGEAKKRLKDMGNDLDAPPYMSPTHVPRSQGWPVFDTARSAPPATILRDERSVSLSARSALEADVSAMQILTQRSSPRARSSRTGILSSDASVTAGKLNSSSVPSIEIPSPMQSGRADYSDTTKLNNTWPTQQDTTARSIPSPRKSVRVNEEDANNSSPRRPNAEFMRLLSRYEFLRIRALDHKFLEFQQECRHVAMLELMKLKHQTKIENSKLPGDSNQKQTQHRSSEPHPTGCKPNEKRKLHKLLDTDPVFPKADTVSAVPPSYASYYSLPENASSEAASYRLYVAKKDYNPPSERIVESENLFSKIKLSAGDVATSLGAPHIREDGKKYQLVHVNDKFGLVPFSFLQLADEVHDSDLVKIPSTKLPTSTNTERITKMHRHMELRRKLMPQVA